MYGLTTLQPNRGNVDQRLEDGGFGDVELNFAVWGRRQAWRSLTRHRWLQEGTTGQGRYLLPRPLYIVPPAQRPFDTARL
jgi:hypothetical protein